MTFLASQGFDYQKAHRVSGTVLAPDSSHAEFSSTITITGSSLYSSGFVKVPAFSFGSNSVPHSSRLGSKGFLLLGQFGGSRKAKVCRERSLLEVRGSGMRT